MTKKKTDPKRSGEPSPQSVEPGPQSPVEPAQPPDPPKPPERLISFLHGEETETDRISESVDSPRKKD